jgi:hypothetical protein
MRSRNLPKVGNLREVCIQCESDFHFKNNTLITAKTPAFINDRGQCLPQREIKCSALPHLRFSPNAAAVPGNYSLSGG